MAAGDWPSTATLNITGIYCEPGDNGSILRVDVSYDVVLPSGQTVPRVWVWTPSPTEESGIQQLGQAMAGDLFAFEGLAPPTPPA